MVHNLPHDIQRGWVAYLDVYGFSHMVREKQDDYLITTLSQCMHTIEHTILDYENRPSFFLFSAHHSVLMPIFDPPRTRLAISLLPLMNIS